MDVTGADDALADGVGLADGTVLAEALGLGVTAVLRNAGASRAPLPVEVAEAEGPEADALGAALADGDGDPVAPAEALGLAVGSLIVLPASRKSTGRKVSLAVVAREFRIASSVTPGIETMMLEF